MTGIRVSLIAICADYAKFSVVKILKWHTMIILSEGVLLRKCLRIINKPTDGSCVDNAAVSLLFSRSEIPVCRDESIAIYLLI
jgi:hypothetical protein